MVRTASVAAALLALVCLAYPAHPAEQWVRVKSSNFELLTNSGEKRGRDAILQFEQVRSFFMQVTPANRKLSQPVRIIGFRSEKDFQPYRPSEAAAAFYLPGPSCDYIVMKSLTQEYYPGAVHEFVHLLVKHSGVPLPLWLNEGVADLYSTLKPVGGKVLVGDLIPGNFQLLREKKWLDLETLFAVEHDSPHYNERDRAGVFYAESWALAHMLNLSEQYRLKYTDFLKSLATRGDAKAAFRLVYAKTVSQVQKDLENYMRSDRFVGALLATKLEKSAEQPEIRPASPLETGLALADLLALTNGKESAARDAYDKLVKENPRSWEAEEALGYLYWRTHGSEVAREHFERAAKLGSTTAKMYYDYAMLGPVDGGVEDRTALLRKAVELNPDYRDARYYLGMALFQQRNWKEARAELSEVNPVSREQAPSFFQALAYSDYELGMKEEAKIAANRAREYAQTFEEIASAQHLLEFVSQEAAAPPRAAPEKPVIATARPDQEEETPRLRRRDGEPGERRVLRPKPETFRLEGLLVQVDCLDKMARLWIQSSDEKLALEIVNPGEVAIVKGEQQSITHEFTCGPQKPQKVVAHFEMKPNPRLGTQGVVRKLEFK